jgi:hypothetical protein
MGTYIVVSGTDHHARDKGGRLTVREYGSATTKNVAIRLAERVLPPDAEYAVTTLHKTVHEGHAPKIERDLGRGL